MAFFALLSALSIVAAQQLASEQHVALMDFLDAVGCNVTNCLRFAANEPCSGNFLVCAAGDVVQLFITDRGLTGTIPSAVGQLTALQNLNLANNDLVGTIPSGVGQLTALQSLSLANNAKLIGTIPTTFSQLTNLRELYLSNTQLNGTIPPTTAPLSDRCVLDRSFLNCASKPKSSCTCSARLLGDDCENRRPISTGSTSVTTEGATTNRFSGSCTIYNDAWWEWTASCTGNATISTCGFAPTDTRLGIFRGACPSASTRTATTESGSGDCDDFGGCGGSQERATLDVVSGERIIIRLGSAAGGLVNGTLSISCSGITTAPTTTTAAPTTTATTAAGPTTQAVNPSVAPTTTSTAAATTTAVVAGPTTLAVTAMTTVMGTTANASTTAAPPTNASISASAPAATPSSGADIALIAGAAGGGAAALLLLTGLILFFVCRARKAKAGNNERAPAGGNELRESNYAALVLQPNEYDVGDVGRLPASNQYGRINAGAEPQYSDPGVLQAGGGGIQVKQTGVGTEYAAL